MAGLESTFIEELSFMVFHTPWVIFFPMLFLGMATLHDCMNYRIPDYITIGAILLRVVVILPPFNIPFTIHHLYGVFAGILVLFISTIFNQSNGGDIKLMWAIGVWVGGVFAGLTLLMACCTFIFVVAYRLVIKKVRTKKLPFAPCLFVGYSFLIILGAPVLNLTIT